MSLSRYVASVNKAKDKLKSLVHTRETDKHYTSEISISASTGKKEHVYFSCAYACAYFPSVTLLSQVGTCLYH